MYMYIISVIEEFGQGCSVGMHLSSSVFIVLQTTKSLLPFPEELKIVSLCCEAIASKACVDASRVDWSYTYNRKKLQEENGNEPANNGIRSRVVPKDWWVEDLSELEIDLFKRVMLDIKRKGVLHHEVIGEALKAYAYRRLPGVSKNMVHGEDTVTYQSIVDTIVWLLSGEKGSVSCSFLIKLLKAAIILDSGETAKLQLVRKIGQQLEEASVNDLLIRAGELESMLYDVDTVHKIVVEFLKQDHSAEIEAEKNREIELEKIKEIGSGILTEASKLMVAKLIDAYLAENAKHQELPLSKFVSGFYFLVSICLWNYRISELVWGSLIQYLHMFCNQDLLQQIQAPMKYLRKDSVGLN